MKTKEMGNIGPPETCSLWVGNDYSTPFVYTSQAAIRSINYVHSQGEDIPHFHRRLRAGELLPMTNWSQFEQRLLSLQDALYYGLTGGLHDYAYWDPGVPFPDEYLSPNKTNLLAIASTKSIDYRDLIQAAASRIYSSGWDVATFTGELGQTIRMFVDLVRKIIGLVRGWPPGTPWGLWLEARYGWRTLNYDMNDVIRTIINIDDKRKRWRESCSTRERWDDVTTSVSYSSQFNDDVVNASSFVLSTRGTVAADIIPPKFQMNPFVTAWELTRFSFVIDWFLGMGQWLSAMSFLTLQSEHTAAGGFQLTCTKSVTHSGTPNPGYYIQGPTVRSIVSESRLTVRTPQSVSLFPQLRVKLDVAKVVDLCALLAQLAIRRR